MLSQQQQIPTRISPLRQFEPLFLEQLLDSAFAFTEKEVKDILEAQTWITSGICEIGRIKSPNNEFEIVKLSKKAIKNNLTQISYKDNNGLVYLVTISEDDSQVVEIEISGKRACQVAIGISAAFVTGKLKKLDVKNIIGYSFLKQKSNSVPIKNSLKPSL